MAASALIHCPKLAGNHGQPAGENIPADVGRQGTGLAEWLPAVFFSMQYGNAPPTKHLDLVFHCVMSAVWGSVCLPVSNPCLCSDLYPNMSVYHGVTQSFVVARPAIAAAAGVKENLSGPW